MTNWVQEAQRRTVVDIGQLTGADRKTLNKAVKAGLLIRWRDHWLGCLGPKRWHWRRP